MDCQRGTVCLLKGNTELTIEFKSRDRRLASGVAASLEREICCFEYTPVSTTSVRNWHYVMVVVYWLALRGREFAE